MVLLHEQQLLLEISVSICSQGISVSSLTFLSPIDVILHRLVHGQLHLILDSEVIGSKTGIVSLQNDASIVYRICKDLSPQVLDGLEIMPPVSDLGSLLLQVFSDFAL